MWQLFTESNSKKSTLSVNQNILFSCQIMNSLWGDEEPEVELPVRLRWASLDISVIPSGPKFSQKT